MATSMTIERIEIVLPIQGRTGTIMAQRVDASGRYIDPIDLQLGFDGSELPQEVQDALASIDAQQQATIATLTQKLSAMTTERDDALSEKASLQTQLDSANERISTLESRIVELTAEPEVPIVSRRQARLALLQMNLLERIEASLAQSSKAVQIEYEADAWRRDNPTLVAMAEQLGMDAEQIDQFFALAGTL